MAKEVLGLARRAIDSSRPPRGAADRYPRASRQRTRPPGPTPFVRGDHRGRGHSRIPDRVLSEQPFGPWRHGGGGCFGSPRRVVPRASSRLNLADVSSVPAARRISLQVKR